MFRRTITLLACLSAPAGLAAQQAPANGEYGRIVGHVFSTRTGDALPSVQVFIAGTGIGTLTSPDGRFVLRNVPIGTHSLQTEMIGYGSKIVSDVVVEGGDPAVVDISLEPQAIELAGLTVSVEAERGNTSALMGERRRAAVVVDAIGQDQISRSPDGDAGAVLKRVPGVSLVDGKYAFVRGLGERYSATTLNGARLASPVPDKKVIPLDVIPSGMLESIVTAKTYSPDQPGDYSGGLVQMRTKDFPTSRIFSLGASSGWNSVATFKDGLGYAGGSLDFLGLDDGTRDLPSAIPTDAAVRYSRNGLSRDDLATIGRSFGGDWGPTPVSLSPDQSFSALLRRRIRPVRPLPRFSEFAVPVTPIRAAGGLGGARVRERRSRRPRSRLPWRLHHGLRLDRRVDEPLVRAGGGPQDPRQSRVQPSRRGRVPVAGGLQPRLRHRPAQHAHPLRLADPHQRPVRGHPHPAGAWADPPSSGGARTRARSATSPTPARCSTAPSMASTSTTTSSRAAASSTRTWWTTA